MKTTRHDSFAAYVLPSVLAFALSGLYTIVDGFFIGQSLGDLGLAAITLAYPAAALLQAVGTGIGLAGAIRCTILQARGEEQTPRTCFSGTVLLLLATSAAFAAVLLGLLGPVLTVLGAQDEARPLAAEYIRVIAYGTAFQILATGLVPFIRNLGGSAFAMVAMGTGFVTNIALDYLFVWEFHWGMAGGAWATVIGQAATMLLAIGYLVRRFLTSFRKKRLIFACKLRCDVPFWRLQEYPQLPMTAARDQLHPTISKTRNRFVLNRARGFESHHLRQQKASAQAGAFFAARWCG